MLTQRWHGTCPLVETGTENTPRLPFSFIGAVVRLPFCPGAPRSGKTIKALQKPAYVKNKQDIIFSGTESEKLFTAALYNIKTENYGVDYAVRTYAVLQGLNGNKVTVYVTETQAYSVNATAEARFAAIGNTYTDVEGKSWAESYETRVYLYENILSKIVGGNFTAPAAANS